MLSPKQGESLQQFLKRGIPALADTLGAAAANRALREEFLRLSKDQDVGGDLNLDSTFWMNAVLCMERSEPMEATGNPLRFWKELAHEGEFVKDTGSSRVAFKITRGMMDHWHRTHGEMSRDGMVVPVPVEHTKDPEKRRATVVETKRAPNKRGQSALYGLVEFVDAEAAKLARTANVSIYVPKKTVNGHGKEYVMPIEHVAITDYPVLHDLEPFQAVALSLTADGEPDMTLRELATMAGIDPSITDEQQLIMALSQVIAKQPPAGPQRPAVPPRPGVPAGPPRMPAPMAASLGGDQPQVPALSKPLLNIVRNARKSQLDALSKGDSPKLTPAARKKLEEHYLTDDALQLSTVEGYDDGFDTMVEALSMTEPVRKPGGKTPPQAAVALSKEGADQEDTDENNALTRGMAARAKERSVPSAI